MCLFYLLTLCLCVALYNVFLCALLFVTVFISKFYFLIFVMMEIAKTFRFKIYEFTEKLSVIILFNP